MGRGLIGKQAEGPPGRSLLSRTKRVEWSAVERLGGGPTDYLSPFNAREKEAVETLSARWWARGMPSSGTTVISWLASRSSGELLDLKGMKHLGISSFFLLNEL